MITDQTMLSTSCWKSAKICVIRVLKMTSHSEGIIYKVRSCELERFIRGLLLKKASNVGSASEVKVKSRVGRPLARLSPPKNCT
jgi:hypothetical protein